MGAPSSGTYNSPGQELVPEGGALFQAEQDPTWKANSRAKVPPGPQGSPPTATVQQRHQGTKTVTQGCCWVEPGHSWCLEDTATPSLGTCLYSQLCLQESPVSPSWASTKRPGIARDKAELAFLTHRGSKCSGYSSCSSGRNKIPFLCISAEIFKDLKKKGAGYCGGLCRAAYHRKGRWQQVLSNRPKKAARGWDIFF